MTPPTAALVTHHVLVLQQQLRRSIIPLNNDAVAPLNRVANALLVSGKNDTFNHRILAQ